MEEICDAHSIGQLMYFGFNLISFHFLSFFSEIDGALSFRSYHIDDFASVSSR